jgi:hypothetical protein
MTQASVDVQQRYAATIGVAQSIFACKNIRRPHLRRDDGGACYRMIWIAFSSV